MYVSIFTSTVFIRICLLNIENAENNETYGKCIQTSMNITYNRELLVF